MTKEKGESREIDMKKKEKRLSRGQSNENMSRFKDATIVRSAKGRCPRCKGSVLVAVVYYDIPNMKKRWKKRSLLHWILVSCIDTPHCYGFKSKSFFRNEELAVIASKNRNLAKDPHFLRELIAAKEADAA